MGVDYTGNFGIGVLLDEPDFDAEGIDWEDMYEYVEDMSTDMPIPEGFEIEYFEVGYGNYSGESNEWYLCIKDPFEGGLEEFNKRYKLFQEYLKYNLIDCSDEIKEVGGLNVW